LFEEMDFSDKLLESIVEWTEEGMADALQNFLTLVNEQRFPVWDDFLYETSDDIEFWLEKIPIQAQGFGGPYAFDENFGRDDLLEPYKFLLRLAGREWYGKDVYSFDWYPDYPLPDDFTLSNLPDVLDKMHLDEPLNGLAALIRVVLEQTGNTWFDVSEEHLAECNCYPDWDDDYDNCLRQWKQAQQIQAQCSRLVALVEKDWFSGMDKIYDALIRAHHRRLSGNNEENDNDPQLPLPFATDHESNNSQPNPA
jgi:hypothetical protein